MSDTFTETTTTSWMSRIKGAFSGIFFGLLLLVGGVILLFWNEGRTVKNKRALNEGEKNVLSVPVTSVNSGNESKLIHFSGFAETKDTLVDDEFDIAEVAIQLERKVEMYQWEEKEESVTTKKLGGSEETTTNYKYAKVWSSSLNNSAEFKKQDNHENPSQFPYEAISIYASKVFVGAFQLPENLVHQIGNAKPLQFSKARAETVKNLSISNSTIYIGKGNIRSPKVGDVKITYEIVKPQDISIVGKQAGNSLVPYVAKNGNSVLLLQSGTVAAEQMFKNELSSNKKMGWILRLVGFILIFGAFSAIFKILLVIGDVVPFIGNIIAFGTSIISGILAIAISFIVIAIAWIYYRPVIGISLLAISVAFIVYVIVIGRKKKVAAQL